MNILNPYDTFTDVHASSASYWCRDKPKYDQRHDVDPKDQPCDPDDDPRNKGGGGGGSSGGGEGGGWDDLLIDPPDDTYENIDPADNADLGGDEDTTQW